MPNETGEMRTAVVLEDQYSKQAEAAAKAFDLLTKHLEKVAENTAKTEEHTKASMWLQYGQAALKGAGMVLQAVEAMAVKTFHFMEHAVLKAADAEEAMARFNASLEVRGMGQYSDALKELASRLADHSRFSAGAVRSAETLMVTLGVQAQHMERGTQVAVDLAAALGLDLDTSARLVTRALQGNTAMLARLGITLKLDTIPAAERAAYVLDELGKRFGGRAQAEMGTFNVQLEKARQAFSALEKAIGDTFVKSGTGQLVLKAIQEAFETLTKFVKENGPIITGFFIAIGQAVISMVQVLATALEKIAPMIDDAFRNSILGDKTAQADFGRFVERVAQQVVDANGMMDRSVNPLSNSWVDWGEHIQDAAAKVFIASKNQEELTKNTADFRRQVQEQYKNTVDGQKAVAEVMETFDRTMVRIKERVEDAFGDKVPKSFSSSIKDAMAIANSALTDLQGKLAAIGRGDIAPGGEAKKEEKPQIGLPSETSAALDQFRNLADVIMNVGSQLRGEAEQTARAWTYTAEIIAYGFQQDYERWAATIEGQRAIQTAARNTELEALGEREGYVEEHWQAILAMTVAATNEEFALAKRKAESQKAIDEKTAKDQKALDKTKRDVLIAGTESLFGALARLAEQGGRKQFAMAKTFMYAEAVVAGITSIQKAWSSASPPWNIPAIVAATAAMMANLQAIRSTEPGSAGSAPSAGGAGGGGGAESGGGTEAAGTVEGAGRQTVTVEANINGLAVVTDQTGLARAIAEALGAQRPFTVGAQA